MSNRQSRSWDDVQPYYIGGQGAAVAGTDQYGTTGFYWYKFNDDHGQDRTLQFSFQLPHKWAYGTDVHFHLHVIPSTNGAAGNDGVMFQMAYQWVNINGTYSTTTNTTDSQLFRVGVAEANKHILWEFPVTSGSGKTLSGDLTIILTRLSKTSGSDNYTGDIWLRYTDLHCEIDKSGSASELSD